MCPTLCTAKKPLNRNDLICMPKIRGYVCKQSHRFSSGLTPHLHPLLSQLQILQQQQQQQLGGVVGPTIGPLFAER